MKSASGSFKEVKDADRNLLFKKEIVFNKMGSSSSLLVPPLSFRKLGSLAKLH